MPTEKPRVSFALSEEELEQITSYRFAGKFKNQTQAILSLIEKGLADFSPETKKAPDIMSEARGMAVSYDKLDSWGKKVVKDVIKGELARIEAAKAPAKPQPAKQHFPLPID